jgi:hypothetical protein
MKNELDNAELKARTLPDLIDRNLFTVHADTLRERLGRMTTDEASMVMFDEEDVPR